MTKHVPRCHIGTVIGPYLHSTIIGPVIALFNFQTFDRSAYMSFGLSQPYCMIIGPFIALLYAHTFGRLEFMSFGLSQPCCKIIGPVIALLYVVLGIIPVAHTGLYLRNTILWYHMPVPTVTSWYVLGHIFVSCSYCLPGPHSLCTNWVPITL